MLKLVENSYIHQMPMEQVVDNKLEQYLHVWKCWEQIKKLCIGNRPCKEY